MTTIPDALKTVHSPAGGLLLRLFLVVPALLCVACGSGSSGDSGATWPGLGKLDCSLLDNGLPAKLTVDYAGTSHTIAASVFISVDDSVAVRVACINPDNPSESLAAALAASTYRDMAVGTYTITTLSQDNSDLAAGKLALDEVDGQFGITRASQATSDPADYEIRNDGWKGRYDPTSGLPPSDEKRAKFTFTDAVSLTVTAIVELPKDQQTMGTESVRTHEIHGSMEMAGLHASNSGGDAADTDGRGPLSLRAEF
jgi:hypothetical protein